jgi:hypothetical protein
MGAKIRYSKEIQFTTKALRTLRLIHVSTAKAQDAKNKCGVLAPLLFLRRGCPGGGCI